MEVLILLVVIIGLVLFTVKSALSELTPPNGKTNIPIAPGVSPTLPFIGNAWTAIGLSNMRDVHTAVDGYMTKAQKLGHRAVSFWMGPKLTLVTADAKINEVILNSPKSNTKPKVLFDMVNIMCDGLFSRNGVRWSSLRRPLNKCLQSKNVVDHHYDVMVAKSEELCDMFGSIGEGTFDVSPYIKRCAVDIVLETVMGVEKEHRQTLHTFDLSLGKRQVTSARTRGGRIHIHELQICEYE